MTDLQFYKHHRTLVTKRHENYAWMKTPCGYSRSDPFFSKCFTWKCEALQFSKRNFFTFFPQSKMLDWHFPKTPEQRPYSLEYYLILDITFSLY